MQTEFTGLFAEIYDILHSGLSDVEAYVGYGHRFGKKILELGSGTGRVLIPLARAEMQVTGVDVSDDMLGICEHKLGNECPDTQKRIRLIKADVIDLQLNDVFDLIIAPCNLINCLTGPGEGLALLRSAKRHLKDGGVFILDNSVPDISDMVRSDGVTMTYNFTHPTTGTAIRDIFTARYNFCLQTETDHIILEERDGDKLLRRAETEDTLTFYMPRELRMMFGPAGLQIFHEQGSIMKDVPIDAGAREMVFFCRKA